MGGRYGGRRNAALETGRSLRVPPWDWFCDVERQVIRFHSRKQRRRLDPNQEAQPSRPAPFTQRSTAVAQCADVHADRGTAVRPGRPARLFDTATAERQSSARVSPRRGNRARGLGGSRKGGGGGGGGGGGARGHDVARPVRAIGLGRGALRTGAVERFAPRTPRGAVGRRGGLCRSRCRHRGRVES